MAGFQVDFISMSSLAKQKFVNHEKRMEEAI